MRKDYVIECICAAVTLQKGASSHNVNVDNALQLLSDMISTAWTVEYNKNKQLEKSHADVVNQNFWNAVHTELECTQKVYKFAAWHGPVVNPPGQEGNVHLEFSGINTVERICFDIKLVDLKS